MARGVKRQKKVGGTSKHGGHRNEAERQPGACRPDLFNLKPFVIPSAPFPLLNTYHEMRPGPGKHPQRKRSNNMLTPAFLATEIQQGGLRHVPPERMGAAALPRCLLLSNTQVPSFQILLKATSKMGSACPVRKIAVWKGRRRDSAT